ncbi:hypothetical protein VPH35_006967 [Triticum aestivum]
MCRGTASREPEPRRHRRHAAAAAEDPVGAAAAKDPVGAAAPSVLEVGQGSRPAVVNPEVAQPVEMRMVLQPEVQVVQPEEVQMWQPESLRWLPDSQGRQDVGAEMRPSQREREHVLVAPSLEVQRELVTSPQGVHPVLPMQMAGVQADQPADDDTGSDAQSAADAPTARFSADERLAESALPPPELAARALAVMDTEDRGPSLTDLASGLPGSMQQQLQQPGLMAGMMPLYSPPRQEVQPVWADFFSCGTTGVDSFFCVGPSSHELPPLPPSLGSCAMSPWGSSVTPVAAAGHSWELLAPSWSPSWLPSWEEAQLQLPQLVPTWASGPEVVFGPGTATPQMQPTTTPPPQPGFSQAQSIEERRARQALADANLSGAGLIAVIADRVSMLHIDEQKAFINKIASLLSSSILPAPAPPVSARRNLKSKLAGVIKPPRQSARLLRLQSNFSSSRRAQAAICVKLGFIKREADFNDDTLLAYIDFFREPMPTDNVAKLMQIARLSSLAQLRLPDEELQAILDELSMRAA